MQLSTTEWSIVKDNGIKDTMVEIVNLIKSTTAAKEPSHTPSTVTTTTSTEMTLEELNGTHDRYMAHLKCLKDNDLLTPERKQNIVQNLEDIMSQISAKHGIKRGIDAIDTNRSSNNSSSVS